MMKVTLIAPEGLKEKYLRDAADEYIKRLRSFCDLKIAEFSPFKLPDKPSESQIAAADYNYIINFFFHFNVLRKYF